jgi:hypothetical protein
MGTSHYYQNVMTNGSHYYRYNVVTKVVTTVSHYITKDVMTKVVITGKGQADVS